MGTEIERKFLVTGNGWKEGSRGVRCCQGYICSGTGATVRVRIAGDRGTLTVKGPGDGMVRPEFEYPVPLEDARQMLELCGKPLIDKERYRIVHQGVTWEVDEFRGANSGLVIAEVELDHPQREIPLPGWLGREVTGDPRYYNVSLVGHPYSAWRAGEEG